MSVLEKNSRVGGLMRYGIPDFKMEKSHIDRRMTQMEAEGVSFQVNQHVGKNVAAEDVLKQYDAVVLAGGAEFPRDLPVPGRERDGVMYAMDFLRAQNKVNAGDILPDQVKATGKHGW